jgi:superkiller protein 3
LPDTTPDLAELIDRAGDFLIDRRDYEDGLELYRAAVKKLPSVAALHQGLSCCASHQGFNDEALAAAERALQLEPDYQPFVNDLGWSLYKVGRLEEARTVLERAVSMGPSDGYARNNLRICQEEISKRSEGSSSKRKRSRAPGAGC